jgi:U3 small nucleolar RNA-associated protein 19
LLEAELGKDMKKTPVVEYQIPKYVFTGEDTELNPLGTLMAKVLESNKST